MRLRFQHQTIFGVPQGNCLIACIASITEIGIEECPELGEHFESWYLDRRDDSWWNALGQWLYERGFHAMMFGSQYQMPGGTPVIVVGPQLSDDSPHAVIYRDGFPIWDPNPHDPSGLSDIIAWLWVCPQVKRVHMGAPGSYRIGDSHLVQ